MKRVKREQQKTIKCWDKQQASLKKLTLAHKDTDLFFSKDLLCVSVKNVFYVNWALGMSVVFCSSYNGAIDKKNVYIRWDTKFIDTKRTKSINYNSNKKTTTIKIRMNGVCASLVLPRNNKWQRRNNKPPKKELFKFFFFLKWMRKEKKQQV